MTPNQFQAWREKQGFTRQTAAEELGISRSTVELYEAGQRRDNKQPVEIPKSIEMACHWISIGQAILKNNPYLASDEARLRARDLMYHMSLPVWSVGSDNDSKHYVTWHDMMKDQGKVPKSEPSLFDMLFPYGDPRSLRQNMYRTAPKDSATGEGS